MTWKKGITKQPWLCEGLSVALHRQYRQRFGWNRHEEVEEAQMKIFAGMAVPVPNRWGLAYEHFLCLKIPSTISKMK